MRTWFFTENAYPNLPDADSYESIRVNLPNSHFDPDTGADLYHMYLDMWCAADEMGLDIMNNEHHQTATSMVPAAPILLGILARETRKARLLILGNPIANRKQPIRVAEDMASSVSTTPSTGVDYHGQRQLCEPSRPTWAHGSGLPGRLP